MDEKTLGLKPEESKPPVDNGQSKEKTDSVEDVGGKIEAEVDEILNKPSNQSEFDDLEEITISKGKLKRMENDLNNYRTGLVGIKKKTKEIFKAPKQEQKPAPQPTISEETKKVERDAITKACQNPDVEKNWPEVVKYYTPKRGLKSVDDVVSDLDDAFTLFQKYSKKADDKRDDKTKEIAVDKGNLGSSSGGDGGKDTQKKSILKRPEKIQSWYKKPEEKKD